MSDTPAYNIHEHILVPKHEKITPEAAQKLLDQFHAELKNLPKISIKDAAIQHLEPKDGDVIRITRDSPTAGKTFFFRVVVE
ncbi:MAG: DNA-directed RNA polymerase subunit H [Nanoarchaeota archaeon]|nr:DNA-directed RNA polymerase subunit H [Nanoarchaeota archaeon]